MVPENVPGEVVVAPPAGAAVDGLDVAVEGVVTVVLVVAVVTVVGTATAAAISGDLLVVVVGGAD